MLLEEDDLPVPVEIQLKTLKPKHKEAMSLLAQGISRQDVARMTDFTPEYITWLARQPVCQAYLKEIGEYVDSRYVAMLESTADAIGDTLKNGSERGRLQAAKLTLEVTGRLGRERPERVAEQSEGRLEQLADRLVTLLREKRGNTYAGQARVVEDDISGSSSGKESNLQHSESTLVGVG